jgi:orotidine-5'-phosphate decarboxylase
LDAADLRAVGVAAEPSEQTLRLARLAQAQGVRGLVCSSAEVGSLREALGPEAVLVTPGIRPSGADVGDQKRVGTPASAIRAGSSLLVVGRPIRDAADPAAAAHAIADEIAGAAT